MTNPRLGHAIAGAVAATLALSSLAPAQSLASRISSASSRAVQFSFAARPGVCGDGHNYISTSQVFVGSGGNYSTDHCQASPVKVILDLADRSVVRLRTYVGTAGAGEPGVQDLGTVTPAEAADYLVSVAARADGRLGRDAIFAALLGENVDVTSRLIDIGRDTSRPVETRQAALSGLLRSAPPQLDRAGAALVQIATSETDAQSVRRQALSVLARLDHGAGIQPLVQLASGNLTSWLGRESMSVLARSGDPRARQFLRTVVQRTDLPDDILAAALRALGGSYVTGQDAAMLRSLYPRLTGQSSRNAVLSSLASLGGTDNVQWLMGIVRDENQTMEARRQALGYANRAGASSASLVALYDAIAEASIRERLISAYQQLSDKAATDKLVWIARNEQNYTLRRRAINALSRSSDPAVKQALQSIVER